jgi:hypothetical protein
VEALGCYRQPGNRLSPLAGHAGLLQATVALPLGAYAVDFGHAIAFGVGMQHSKSPSESAWGSYCLPSKGSPSPF